MSKVHIQFVIIVTFLFLACFTETAKAQNEYEVYPCLNAEDTELTPEDVAPKSDDVCDSDTRIHVEYTGNTEIVSSLVAERQGGGPFTTKLKIKWKPNIEGTIKVNVYYERKESGGDPTCKWEPWKHMYTYTIHKKAILPGGQLSGGDKATASDNATTSTFDLTFEPLPTTAFGRIVTAIEYWNGKETVTTPIRLFTNKASLTYYATGLGKHTVTTRIKNLCGEWFDGPLKVVEVFPSCYQDNPDDVSLTVDGAGAFYYTDVKGYKVDPNTNYKITVNGITDFANHYFWNTDDGGKDIIFDRSNNTFKVTKGLGSYSIIASKKNPGRELCVNPEEIKVFLGGRNVLIKQFCQITIPDDLPALNYRIEAGDIVLQHFAATIESDRAIVIKPGVTLDMGAQLILIQPDPAPQREDADLVMNFVQTTTYDEYGQKLGESRVYFDEQARQVQSQYRNLTRGVITAQASLYDAQGRAAISTLPAPVHASTEGTTTNKCGETITAGEKAPLAYKSNFVQGPGGTTYDYTHFDITREGLSKEQTPDPVDASQEGSLGWYYSNLNGTGSNERLNEPLVATTSYPYSRTLFKQDGTGEVHGVAGPGDAYHAGANHVAKVGKEPVAKDDQYLDKYFSMREQGLKLVKPEAAALEGQFFKTKSWDQMGNKSILYSDKSGHPIISFYYGKDTDTDTDPITTSYQFYDLAGRLITSVTPNGVEQYEKQGVSFNDIDKTSYFYNSKGWLTATEEKDAGRMEYVYRKDGKIRFSQNAAQRPDPTVQTPERYSYINYDVLGRPIESGEYVVPSGGISFKSDRMLDILNSKAVDGDLPNGENAKRERLYAFYDDPAPVDFKNRKQRFVQGAVSYTQKDNVITTYYSYDERGRPEWVAQDIKGLGVKTIDYLYGPTGAVQEVAYQKGIAGEQFSHYYEYDADGRLYKVFTSQKELQYNKQGVLLNNPITDLHLQATYHYYLHGPLKRVELADKYTRKELVDGQLEEVHYDKLQGIDYLYTADGKLKAINQAAPAKDPGGDTYSSNRTRKDVFGLTLDYHVNDYASHKQPVEPFSLPDYQDQYGGQVKALRWHSPVEGNQSYGYGFAYDERYQFKKADWGQAGNGTLLTNPLQPYHEAIGKPNSDDKGVEGYDLNGNIRSLLRKDHLGQTIADYTYYYGQHNNQLTRITHQDKDVLSYTYNAIGQLTEEKEGDQTKRIEYDVTGKVTGVRDGSDRLVVAFAYDDRGFRLSKTNYDENGQELFKTWYIRDASGSVMSTYEQRGTAAAEPVEMPVYGATRIGFFKPKYGFTFYEVGDHLGNVRAVIGKSFDHEYLATMETSRISREEDGKEEPGKENDGFLNLRRHYVGEDVGHININHTPSDITVNGIKEKVIDVDEVYRINNVQDSQNGNLPRSIGAGKMLPVYPGDIVKAEVFAKYAKFPTDQSAALNNLALSLASAFSGVQVVKEGMHTFDHLNHQVAGTATAFPPAAETKPKAFLNYILYNKNLRPLRVFQDQLDAAAEYPYGSFDKLEVGVEVEKEGFIYVYFSNESDQNIDVYFDDFKVTHLYSDVVAGGDYYPYGLEMEDRQITREDYRHGYQGQYAEKDKETGWNSFQLRMYDARIGRWTSVDPYRQYTSPYVGMGNDPVTGVDPDGGFSRFGSWLYQFTNGGDRGYAVDRDEWYVGDKVDFDGTGIAYHRTFDWGGQLQEGNINLKVGGRFGPFSGSFGFEIAAGNSNRGISNYGPGFNIASRFVADGNAALSENNYMTIFNPSTWRGTGVQVKTGVGVKFSDKPTVLSTPGKATIGIFTKRDISIFGTGGEVKASLDPNSGTRSYSLGATLGAQTNVQFGSRSSGVEVKYTGAALWTDNPGY